MDSGTGKGGVVVLAVGGVTTLKRIKELVSEQFYRGNTMIVVDLRALSHLDSTGLGDLVAAYTLAKRNGGVIKLVSDSGKIDNLLDITRISSVFEIYRSPEEAVSSFGPA